MHSTRGAGAADETGVVEREVVRPRAHRPDTAGGGAMNSSTGARPDTAGVGAMYSPTSAGAADTGGAGATYSPEAMFHENLYTSRFVRSKP